MYHLPIRISIHVKGLPMDLHGKGAYLDQWQPAHGTGHRTRVYLQCNRLRLLFDYVVSRYLVHHHKGRIQR